MTPLRLPSGLPLPGPFRWLYGNGVRELPPWSFLDDAAQALSLRDEFLLETGNDPRVDWFPFARHQAHDDFAGFMLVDGVATGEVATVHLTWRGSQEQPGWPSIQRYRDFWTWFRECMLVETAEWGELNLEDAEAEWAVP